MVIGTNKAVTRCGRPGEDNAIPEAERSALLDQASRDQPDNDPIVITINAVRAAATAILGGVKRLGREISNDHDLLVAIDDGLPFTAIDDLRAAGYSSDTLAAVIAPTGTLLRRKMARERLTRAESDAAWRLPHLLAAAEYTLADRAAALAWLARPKASLANATPLELAKMSVGTAQVEQLLRRLDHGDIT